MASSGPAVVSGALQPGGPAGEPAVGFWAQFAAEHYRRAPLEADDPPVGLGVGPAELFALLVRSCAERGAGPKDPYPRFYIAGRQVMEDLADYLPAPADGSLEGYLARLERQLGGQPYLLVVQRMQAASRWLWKRAAGFLAGLYQATGVLPADAEVEAFVGRYRNTPTGIHREHSGVFVSMVHGEKDMLVWPPEAGDALPLATARYGPAAASATRLRCAPGRLVYWPSYHWHVGECAGGPTAGLHVGLIERPPQREDLLAAVRGEVPAETTAGGGLEATASGPGELGLPAQYQTAAPALAATYGDPARVRDGLATDWLRRRTGLGFTAAPPRWPAFPVQDADLVARDSVHPIVLVGRDADSSWLAADGRVAQVRPAPALTRLIERLNAGEPILVQHALTMAGTPIERDLLTQALSLLAAWRALSVTRDGEARRPTAP
jgi:50S ribosomal protein L16 3-hydroxylase